EPFTRERATEFVAAVLAAEAIAHERGTVDAIVRVADCGVPFFLQVLIQECGIEARRNRRALAAEDVGPVFPDPVRGPGNRARFSHYHSRLREHYGEREETARIVLEELVRHPTRSVEELDAVLQLAGEARARLEPTLTLLESDYYIERDRDQVAFANG